MELHEKKIEEYMEKNPSATYEEAYEATGDTTFQELGDHMADLADQAQRQSEEH
jgi:hypothetical protein